MLTIKCKDSQQELKVKFETIQHSALLKGFVEEDSEEIIEFENIRFEIFNSIIEFCEHLQIEEFPQVDKPLRTNDITVLVSNWFVQFLDKDKQFLFELISAANFLNIPSLLQAVGLKIATLLLYKDLDQISEILNLNSHTII